MENKITLVFEKEEAQRLLEYVQAIRNSGIDTETYLQDVFDAVYQKITAVQEMSQEVNNLLYEGLSRTCL